MSGIFGIYHPDNQPIHPSHLQGMAEGSAHRGPDGTKTIVQPHIGFGHSMLHTTPESLTEVLPYSDPESGITITADARIDNREELFNKLAISQKHGISDSQLIIFTYKKWGIDAFPHLLGDFAFVLWDPSKQQLVCARDYIGVKPFYYHSTPAQFLFSSEIKQLAEHPNVPLIANEQMVAEYLSFSFCSKTETLFQEINRLSPGHYLIATSQGIQIDKYWSLNPRKRIYYKKSKEYTEHFLELFKNAVSCRLRSNSQPSAQLSGGLDSSCVVGMASHILRHQNKKLPEVYGMIFPGLAFDEQRYIKSVSEKFQLNVHCVESQHANNVDWLQQSRHSFEPPDMPNSTICNSVTQLISQKNSRVLLSGIGGDELFSGSGYPYIDLFRDHQYSKILKHLRYSARFSKRFALKRFGINTFWPVIPVCLRKMLCNHQAVLPPWLSNKFIQNTRLQDRLQNHDIRPTTGNLSALALQNVVYKGTVVFFLEVMDRYYASYQIEYRSPFLDRTLTEFAIAIPEYERQLAGRTKILLRNRNNTLLPGDIKGRQGKADFSYFFGKVFCGENVKKLATELSIAQSGWINQKKLNEELAKKVYQVKLDPYHSGNQTWEMWFVFAIEIWYKSFLNKQ